MSTPSHDAVIEELQRAERELQEARLAARAAEQERKKAEKLSAARLLQLRTMQTLNLGIFTALEEQQIFTLACQSVVHQLQWDCAAVIKFSEAVPELAGQYHMTEQQVDHLRRSLAESKPLLDAAAQHAALTTYRVSEATALALRTLFHTDQVVLMPMLFGKQFYSYLAACAHTERNKQRTEEEIEFLSILASQIAHALQNSGTLVNLEEQNTKLLELDDLKNSFISITSHQLRTPLSIVKWILSMLETDPSFANLPEQKKLIEQAYISNERLIHVVNDLLNVSRIQEGKLPHNPQPTDLHTMMSELLATTLRLCESKQLSLITNIEVELPPLSLDPILFREAMQNLLDNAVDYNQEGGTIRVALEKGEKDVKIHVTNTGLGIQPSERQTIFNQFYRSEQAMSLHPNGNGLGLFLSRAIIRQHDGTISYASEPGKETTFTVTLPLP